MVGKKRQEKINIVSQGFFILSTLCLSLLLFYEQSLLIAGSVMILLPITAQYALKYEKILLFTITALIISFFLEPVIATALILTSGMSRALSELLVLPYKHKTTYIHQQIVGLVTATVSASFFLTWLYAVPIGIVVTVTNNFSRESAKNIAVIMIALLLYVIT